MTDQELIHGFLNGGKREYAQVVNWIAEVVRAKLWTERVAADDVIADTAMKLLINLRDDAFRLESAFRTYVQRITLYTVVDAWRRVKPMRTVDNVDAIHDESTPYSLIEAQESEQLFQRVVGMLPTRCRGLWVMTFDNGLTAREIARKLGTSEGSIRTSLSRCKDKAAEILKQIS